MIIFTAKTFGNLPVYDVLSRLIQGFLYNNIVPYEHDGFKHSSGKVFKSTNYRFTYKAEDNVFKFYFTSLMPETEDLFFDYVKQNGMKLANIKFFNEQLFVKNRGWSKQELIFVSNILMSNKNQIGSREFLKPSNPVFLDNLQVQSFQKFETLLRREYKDPWELELLSSSNKQTRIFYNRQPYFTWTAKYKLKADIEMINLLLQTGIGGQTMKGFGMMKISKDNFEDISNQNSDFEPNEDEAYIDVIDIT